MEKEDLQLDRDVEQGLSGTGNLDQEKETTIEPRNPDLVDWDGPDDPENPYNWTVRRKTMVTVSIALITLLTWVDLFNSVQDSGLIFLLV